MPIGAARSGLLSQLSRLPSSVITQYRYEDDSDTTTAVDSVGTNDANISGATYSTPAARGSLSLSHDGSDDETISTSAVDLSAAGDTAGFGLGAFVNPSDANGGGLFFTFESDGDNLAGIQYRNPPEIRSQLQVGGDAIVGSNVTIPTDEYSHLWLNVTDSQLNLYVDGVLEDSTSHALTISSIGAGNYRSGKSAASITFAEFVGDNFSIANDPLTETEINSLT